MGVVVRTTGRRGPYICGIDAAMDVVSGKWKSLILWELDHHGTRRFGELRRGLPGVSEKMLVQHLRELEEDGLVHREVHRQVPPKVEYRLTEHGRTLNEALRPLGRWGTARVERLATAPGDGDGADTVAGGGPPTGGPEAEEARWSSDSTRT